MNHPSSFTLLAVCLCSATASAATVMFDINNGTSPTQSGWVAAPSGSGTNGTYTLATIGLGTSNINPRDRTTNYATGASEASMWRDTIFAGSSGSENPNNGLQLTISGLAANTTYPVTVWAYDSGGGNTRVATWSTNVASAELSFNRDWTRPATLGDYTITINGTTDGSGNLILTGKPHSSGATGADGNVFVNGLAIGDAIPEPGVTLLGGLGTFLLLRRRRIG